MRGNANLYAPQVGTEICTQEAMDSLKRCVFRGSAVSMIVQALERDPLTAEESERLRNILAAQYGADGHSEGGQE